MSSEVYLKDILSVVKGWIDRGDDFVLEEDRDGSHGVGKGKKNSLRDFKESIGLEYFFNCSGSPDLTPIENAWSIPRQYVEKFLRFDEEDLETLAREGWRAIKQSTINQWISSMPARLQECIDAEGQMTSW